MQRPVASTGRSLPGDHVLDRRRRLRRCNPPWHIAAAPSDSPEPEVIDDFVTPLPFAATELDVIETYLDAVLQERIEALQVSRDIALAALQRAKAATRPTADISPIAIDRFARAMREHFSTGEIPFRKAYIRVIVDRIEVDDHQIRIMGRKDVLEQAVLSEDRGSVPVHSFVPNWRPRQDLNL